MRHARAVLLAATVLATSCSGGSETPIAEPDIGGGLPSTTESPPATAPVKTTPTTTASAPTTSPSTTSTTTEVPTTTIDEASILADAEAAYLEAFAVGNEILRDPLNPTNNQRIDDHFVGPNRDGLVEDLRRTVDGNFIAKQNPGNPSFALVVEPAEFVDDDPNLVRMTVCEFNSDRIFEVGTAPDGGDALRRDDPVSILITIRMEFVDGAWKAKSGTRGEDVRDEEERCTAEL